MSFQILFIFLDKFLRDFLRRFTPSLFCSLNELINASLIRGLCVVIFVVFCISKCPLIERILKAFPFSGHSSSSLSSMLFPPITC